MCGIFFACSNQGHVELDDAVKNALRARGPDSLQIHHITTQVPGTPFPITTTSYYLTFASSVLSLRGDAVCVQPLTDPTTGSVLCWNGEVWRINDSPVRGNDTQHIFQLLLKASADSLCDGVASESYQSNVARVLTCVAGPYAFVYYDALKSVVYYGRDRLGRRSLVIDQAESPVSHLSISSVGLAKRPSIEVTTDSILYLDLRQQSLTVRHILWSAPVSAINTTVPLQDEAILPIPSSAAVTDLIKHLSEAVRLRVLDVPTYTVKKESSPAIPSRVAILFSGGLDCTLLARLTHDALPLDQPIDLLNVAFENPRTVRAATKSVKSSRSSNSPASPYETCPDRVTARASFAELTDICATRTWRFVSIDVPYTETLAQRSTVINLMSPHNTEMDLSITLALYFASRGQGYSVTSITSIPQAYTTTSRVLLSGLGADELFGGYSRHAAAFSRTGYHDLISELALDFSRIGTRNLGRDDRVMAYWGREVRYPFLDESFVAFALDLPVWEKTGFRLGKPVPKHFEGSGERIVVGKEEDLDPAKMLLRCAAWRLGMKGVAGEKKRAIQFGARTAKMEGGRTKGTDILVVD